MGTTPAQSVAGAVSASVAHATEAVFSEDPALPFDTALLEELFLESGAALYSLEFGDFCAILRRVGEATNYGQSPDLVASSHQRMDFFRGIKLADLILARACGRGNERAWERFLQIYHPPLMRAAIAICGSETTGRDLADALYAELYGLTSQDGQRRCPLDSYKGRGSLLGWLRTTLAQRHVDHYRRTHREQPLDEMQENASQPEAKAQEAEPMASDLEVLSSAVMRALERRQPDERFLLASYYLDGRTLLQIAQIMGVHEATVSRKLHRLTDDLRKQLLRNLQDAGLSKRAAQEAMATDPRDLEVDFKKLLQFSQLHSFPEKAGR